MSIELTHIHEGDVGTEFIVQVVDAVSGDPIDLTDYDTTTIIFETPEGATYEETASISDAVNGKIKYTSVADFLVPSGTWKLQGHVIDTGNTDHKTEVVTFKVYANIVV